MSIFEGSGVALVTPFKENGEVDFDKMKELVEFHIANGTDAIIVCGTTGEASTLSHEEHLACIKACVEYVDHRIPVIAGAGSNCTGTAIYLSTEAESYGVDGLLLGTPYYNKATQNGLIAHFTAIANSVKIPIILYNVPSRTGCNIQPETAVTLAKTVPNIVGIKEASGNIAQVVKLAKLADGCIDIYSGNDDQVVPLLSLGGKGVISVLSNVAPAQAHEICVTANIAPRDVHDMVKKFMDGDVKGSLDIQLKTIDLCEALFCEVNPIPVKKAVELMGLCGGTMRMPLTEMEPAHVEKLKAAMTAYGLL